MAKKIDMKALALRGAADRIAELRGEIASIVAAFPSLRAGGASRANGPAAPSGRRRRREMSAAQRKAVSTRMRAYWAQRRKQKAAK
jgi:hypothetical protein